MTLATAAEYALMLTAPDAQPDPPPRPAHLSTRERELVTLVARGFTDAQIAAELYISVSTVRVHLSRIYAKFAAAGDPVGDRSELLHRLPDYGLPDRNGGTTGYQTTTTPGGGSAIVVPNGWRMQFVPVFK